MRLLEVYGPVPGCECREDDPDEECGEPAAVALLFAGGLDDHPKSLTLYFFCREHHKRIRSGEIAFRLED